MMFKKTKAKQYARMSQEGRQEFAEEWNKQSLYERQQAVYDLMAEINYPKNISFASHDGSVEAIYLDLGCGIGLWIKPDNKVLKIAFTSGEPKPITTGVWIQLARRIARFRFRIVATIHSKHEIW